MRRAAGSWKIIEGVLKEHAPSAYRAFRPPASAAAIRRLEERFGLKLPAGLVASLRIHDGMPDRVELVNFMSLLPARRIGFWWDSHWRGQREDEFGGNSYTRTRKIKNDIRW